MKTKLLHLLMVALLCTLGAGVAWSQATSGKVKGTITSGGKPVPNAQVILTSIATGKTYKMKTDRDGTFAGVGITFGDYQQEIESATGEKPKMWGSAIIGFGTHHYKYDTGREGDMPLACFSPRKAATVVYNMGAFGESDPLRAKLGKHKIDGSCLHIKKLADLDQATLKAMIVKSVAASRAKESK